jgi:hypothetical protein
MAGPSIGTWVKVRNKSGRTTARVIANKFGGGSYQQGQVITQSEYNSYKERRAKGMKAQSGSASGGGTPTRKERIQEIRGGINQKARDQLTSIMGPKQKGKSRDIPGALARLDGTKAGQRANALAAKEGRQRRANEAAIASGKGNRATRRLSEQRQQKRQGRMTEIRQNISDKASAKRQEVFGKGNKGINEKSMARLSRTKEDKAEVALARKERVQREANQSAMASGKGNKAKRRAGQRVAPTAIRINPANNARTTSRLPGVRRRRAS